MFRCNEQWLVRRPYSRRPCVEQKVRAILMATSEAVVSSCFQADVGIVLDSPDNFLHADGL